MRRMGDEGKVSDERGAAADTSLARGTPSPVSVSGGPGCHVITYRWVPAEKRPLLFLIWVIFGAALVANFMHEVGWDNFIAGDRLLRRATESAWRGQVLLGALSLINFPGFAVAALAVIYFAAIVFLNRTTTTITDTTFTVRRGPVPCPWPGNHIRPVRDVCEVTYACVKYHGRFRCTVYATFRDGRQAALFSVADRADWSAAMAAQVRDWVEEGRPEAPAHPDRAEASVNPWLAPDSYSSILNPALDFPVRVSASSWFPPDRAQRLKIMASVAATLAGVIALIVLAQYLAG